MANFNKVFLLGNLTRDIELRHTSGNQAVANFGLAINRRYRTSSGEDREETTYVDCESWGRQAEVMAQYLSKGRPVFIEGRLKLDTWQDKNDGSNRSKLRIVVENFQFIDSGGGGGGGGAGGGRGGQRQPARSAPQNDGGGYGEPIDADDIPF
ncbi:MAG: single-stranded DNA-binding protein [Planctomycetota bacterium]